MIRSRYAMALVVGLAAGVWPGSSAASAAPVALKEQVGQVLETGWTRTLKARDTAAAQYAQIEPLAASDWRVPYAYALVQLRQLRYPDAAKLLEQVLTVNKGNVTAKKLAVWLAVLTKDYGKALLEMPRLAELLPRDDAAGDTETANLAIVAFLGRLAGFLAGPVKESVDRDALAAAEAKIVARLTTGRKIAYENARKAVLQQSAAMGEEAELTTAGAKEAGEKQKERVIEDLQHQHDDLAARTAAEIARLDELKEKLTYEMDKVATDEQRLAPEFQQVETQAAAVRRDLRGIDERIAYYNALAQQEKDQQRRQFYFDAAARWQLDGSQRAASLRDLDRRAADLNAQRVQLQQQRQTIDARWQRESGRGEKLRGSLDRVRSEKDKVQGQAVSGVTSQVRDQKRRAVALTAYVPLPVSLDEEKTRLLEKFP